MAYDEKLAERARRELSENRGITEKKMFGGIAFMIRGNMCCCIIDDRLMVRVGPDAYERALKLANASAMDYTGKPMRGFVYVSPDGTKTTRQLRAWLQRGLDFAESLPAK